MSLRSGYYSENKRYRDPNLTYKQVIAVFEGLKDAGFIESQRMDILIELQALDHSQNS